MAVYERNPVTGEETTVAGIQDLSVYESRISDIEDVIPSDATSSNQLVTEGDLGTAAAKDFTDTVRPNSHDLVESNAVFSAINNALSSIYTPRGSLTCAELTSSLLIDANVGNVYEMTDAGTTTALFIQGAGETISIGDNVGIIKAGSNTYLFNLMGNAFDLTDYQKKDLASAIEGTTTVEGALGALSTNKATQAEVNGIVNVLGAKNFINNTSVSATDGNVQYTVNSDKSISINILSALSANAGRIVGYINVKAGLTYILTGGVSNKVRVDFRNSDYSMWTDNAQSKEVTSPKQSYSVDTFTPNNDATLMVYIRIDSSTATGNAGTVYPMLRLASDPDNTYQPYAMTNQQITPYIQAISNPNLLDNPWFTVNQRAKSSYSGPNYTVDRWEVLNNKGTVTVNADGSITVTASGGDTWLRQKFDPKLLKKLVGKTITVSIDAVKTGGNVNLYSGYYDASNTWHRISEDVGVQTSRTIVSRTAIVSTLEGGEPKFGEFGIYIQSGQSVTIYSTKLELGSVSTLVMDTAPNFQQELEKCRRYFVRYIPNVNSTTPIGRGFAVNATTMWIDIALPTSMRAMPTLTCSDISNFGYSERDSSSFVEFISMAVGSMVVNHINITGVDNAHTMTIGNTYIIYAKNGAYIDLSADL